MDIAVPITQKEQKHSATQFGFITDSQQGK